VDVEARIATTVLCVINTALVELDGAFSVLDRSMGICVLPERLLQAPLLQLLHSLRSSRIVERIEFDLLLRCERFLTFALIATSSSTARVQAFDKAALWVLSVPSVSASDNRSSSCAKPRCPRRFRQTSPTRIGQQQDRSFFFGFAVPN